MDVVDQFEMIMREFQRLAAGTRLDQLDDPTPCDEWAVRDLFYHLRAGSMFVTILRGEVPSEEEIAKYQAQTTSDEVRSVPDDTLAIDTAASMAEAVELYRAPGTLERTFTLHVGDMSGEKLVQVGAFDILMHSWDLATATGQSVQIPDDVVSAMDDFARENLLPDWRKPGTFYQEVAPPVGASQLERLVAFSGRTVPVP